MGDVSFIYCYKWEGRWADAGSVEFLNFHIDTFGKPASEFNTQLKKMLQCYKLLLLGTSEFPVGKDFDHINIYSI